MKRRKREHDKELSAAWHAAVVHRKARCVVCGSRSGLQAHHVIGQSVIRNEFPFGGRITHVGRVVPVERLEDVPEGAFVSQQELLWDERNGVPVCHSPCHEQHTNAVVRIRRVVLPSAAFEFSRELGLAWRLEPPAYA